MYGRLTRSAAHVFDLGNPCGWRLMAGSIIPVWSNQTIHHFVFTDSTGADYRLTNQDVNGVWWSSEAIHVAYDPSTQKLYFPDGSFWVMGCVSGGNEQDLGTRYPTLMQDTNGNQVLLRYMTGINATYTNSSAYPTLRPESQLLPELKRQTCEL